MLIKCPSCAAEYNVPGPLAPGRAVRCARCGAQWAPVLDAAVLDTAVLEAPEPSATEAPTTQAVTAAESVPPSTTTPPRVSGGVTEPAKPVPMAPLRRSRRSDRLPLLLAWGGSVLVLVLLITAAAVWRTPVMRAWPPSERVFGALGLGDPGVTAHP